LAAQLPGPVSLPSVLQAPLKVSIEMGGRPLPEVLAEMARTSHLRLAAGDGLADQKVTVRFREMPLAEAAQALAAAVDGEWKSVRLDDGTLEYRIAPSERRRERLARARAARRAAEAERDRRTREALRTLLTGPKPRPNPLTEDAAPLPLDMYPQPLFPIL